MSSFRSNLPSEAAAVTPRARQPLTLLWLLLLLGGLGCLAQPKSSPRALPQTPLALQEAPARSPALRSQPVRSSAQNLAQLDSLQAAHAFLNTRADTIENARLGMRHFHQKLAQQRAGANQQLDIVQIGDSHLQADELSGAARQALQRRYGSAGQGLVFPYKVARTNGSSVVRSAAVAGHWRSRRVTATPDAGLPVGVAGFGLLAADSGATFTLRLAGAAARGPAAGFDQLTLLREPGPTAFDWQVRDARHRPLATLPGHAAGYDLGLPLDSLYVEIELVATRRRPAQTQGLLYGLVLENGQPGLRYHAIGANGAAYRHYARAPRFFAQLPLLHPDLLIVSLGTNDAYDLGFDTEQFEKELLSFLGQLRRSCPGTDVLLTAPPDSYRAHRYRNPDLPRLSAVLRRVALAQGLAYWDLAAVMGGLGSMRTWQAARLAQADLVHFTSPGYQLQGLLLALALDNGLVSP